MQKPSANILKYGQPESLPKPLVLRAGALSMVYQDGFIRYLKLGHTEVLRMINHLVRDKNWNTVPQSIMDEKIESGEDWFTITYNCRARQHEVDFLWQCRIEGKADSRLIFSINGKALQPFKRNRAGFTVLHPNRECSGQPVTIQHSDGTSETSSFPQLISPHQPFMDIRGMEWDVGHNRARLEFSGEIFETEDQRNWTDDSYKTYCTPLALPFPKQLELGDQVQQVVELSISGTAKLTTGDQRSYSFQEIQQEYKLPQIGIGRSTEPKHPSEDQLKWLKAVDFDHYQVDLRLFEAGWQSQLEMAIMEAAILDILLETSLFFESPALEVDAFLEVAGEFEDHIAIVNIFDYKKTCTSIETLDQTMAGIKAAFPRASVGAGTNAFFTELNRNRINHEAVDHLVYSINPQVHAFDNDSLVESLYAQPATVETALSFSGGKPVHISPVTFKMRWNPNATEVDDSPAKQADSRQRSLFGACWLLGSIQSLVTTNLTTATYFETVGSKGIMDGDQLFPMYFVFRFLLRRKKQAFKVLNCSDPLVFGGLTAGSEDLVLGNFANDEITIVLPDHWQNCSVRMVDQDNVWELMTMRVELDLLPTHKLDKTLGLPPFALAFLHK